MRERVETQAAPKVATRTYGSKHPLPPCPPKESPPPPPPPPASRFPALDWQRITFGVSGKKIIFWGLSAVGIAGIYALVKNGNITLPDLSDLPDLPSLPSLPSMPKLPQLYIVQPKPKEPAKAATTALDLGQCKFGYQDVFDVESVITGFGSYDWEQTHAPATQTAVAITLVLQAGAVSQGKHAMDEFGLSLLGPHRKLRLKGGFRRWWGSMFGRNKRDGAAENPVAPKHFAGGAASGSGVAVASNAVDFALAIDTIGGVRIPAAFCGIYGFRASHGIISTVGVTPVSPSLDVVGVFSRDLYVLHQVVKVLLQQPELDWGSPAQVLVADDCFGLSTISSVRTADLLARAVSETLGLVSANVEWILLSGSLVRHVNLGTHIASNVPTLRNFLMEEERLLKQDTSRYTTYDGLRDAMLLILRGEFKEKHRKWFKENDPELSPDVDVRVKFAMAPHLDGLHRMALKVKDETRAVINELLLMDALLVIPSIPSLPPSKSARSKELEIFESRALSILSIATMAGCCQVTIPVGNVRGIPISVAVLARYGADIFLLESLLKINPKLQLEADMLKQRKPSVKDDHIIARTSVNERDVPTRPKSINQTNNGGQRRSESQRDGANEGQTVSDDKENNQPKEK